MAYYRILLLMSSQLDVFDLRVKVQTFDIKNVETVQAFIQAPVGGGDPGGQSLGGARAPGGQLRPTALAGDGRIAHRCGDTHAHGDECAPVAF